MGSWKNEDDIKAELRTLTQELRKLREELRGMVTHPKADSLRILRQQSWPPSSDAPASEAADSGKRPKKPDNQKK